MPAPSPLEESSCSSVSRAIGRLAGIALRCCSAPRSAGWIGITPRSADGGVLHSYGNPPPLLAARSVFWHGRSKTSSSPENVPIHAGQAQPVRYCRCARSASRLATAAVI